MMETILLKQRCMSNILVGRYLIAQKVRCLSKEAAEVRWCRDLRLASIFALNVTLFILQRKIRTVAFSR